MFTLLFINHFSVHVHVHSGTSLIHTSLGSFHVSTLWRCPHFMGKAQFTMYARVSIAPFPALRCNRKCIQNDLNVHCNAHILWNRLFRCFCDAHPNHFVCTSGCNTMQAKTLSSLDHNYIVDQA